MEELGQANERKIYYSSVYQTSDWADRLPQENWLVLPIVNDKNEGLLDKVAQTCLGKKVGYICSVGQECEWAHDWFDDLILSNRISKGLPIASPDDFENEPLTTWHIDFDEGFWFAVTSAYDDRAEINTVVCIDLTDVVHKDKLTNLLDKMKVGWLPS